jgi:GTP-sensing pleiotropic transcriptional regulator CodY
MTPRTCGCVVRIDRSVVTPRIRPIARSPLGILVLARAETPYELDDIEMADVLGTFIGRVVTSRSEVDVANEVELAESH